MVSANNSQGLTRDLTVITLACDLLSDWITLKSLGSHFAPMPLGWAIGPIEWRVELFCS